VRFDGLITREVAMGVFSVPVEVSDLEWRRVESVEVWVDTGAFYSSAPRPLLESLGVEPHKRERFILADGRVVESDIGRLWIRIGDRTEITLVLFAESGTEPWLGAYTLEGLALDVDLVNRRLVPKPWLLLAERVPA
jgi:predicted aspartyl protease